MRERIVALLLLLATTPAVALDKAEDIRACARKNFPATSSTQTFRLTTIGRDGAERTLHATGFWMRDSDGKTKAMLYVNQPSDLRGSSYLMLEKSTRDDLFMYLPALNRVRRIQGNQTSDPLWGTDFSYEDIKQVQGIFDSGKLTREADVEAGGKKLYVLSFVPDKAEESAYQRIVSRIDPDSCAALQTEFFRTGEVPHKRLTVDPKEIRQEGKRWVAHVYEMRDLHNETRTTLHFEKISADEDLPGRLFNPQTFYLGR